ncbi:MAG: OmpA family protein [Myxococcales bacterium]|nr:OmpA family protein [Myxococcales bacterium]
MLAADTGAAPKDATVVYLGHDDLSPQLADAQGRFGGYRFAPGPVSVRAEAKGYLPAQAEVVVAAGQDAAVDIALKPDPKAAKGVLVVKAVSDTGRPLSATVDVGAPANLTGKAFSDRPYRAELDPGTYPVTVEADGYAPFEQTVILTGGKPTDVQATLQKGKGKAKKKPGRVAKDVFADPDPAPRKRSGGKGLVRRKGDAILVGKPITFEADSHRLDAQGRDVVKALAGWLKKHPEVGKIRVEVHTDNRGDAADLTRLSERQARSVKSRLVRGGVSPKRVAVTGFGGGKPLKPNLTERGRQANRRVELRILEAK